MGRVVIVSNRLPVTVVPREGESLAAGFDLLPSVGGLATGLSSFYRDLGSLWIGWPGIPADEVEQSAADELDRRLADDHACLAVHLTNDDLTQYYEGFANSTIWPLFHYFSQYCTYEEEQWTAYVRVNRKFADAVIEQARPDDMVWVHDYHLMLVPDMIRQRIPDATIGFFLHIPFPSFETYRLLPWRLEIMAGLLGCDLVGFHTYDFAKHFLASVRNLLGHEHTAAEIAAGRRIVKVDAFPMGIDYKRYDGAPHTPEVMAEVAKVRERVGGRRIVLSVDRLDYSKGILNRIDAIETFLESNPEYIDEVQVILVAVPSRTGVYEYDLLKRQVDEAVGRINGRFGTIGWNPIEYLYTSLDFVQLTALYDVADVCLVTPLRDGMNLIAKEFVAADSDRRGVLVLSEMAGAAKELGEALIVNPNNRVEVANTLRAALQMPDSQRIRRSESMRQRLARYDVTAWAQDFVESLILAQKRQAELAAKMLRDADAGALLAKYAAAPRRAIFLDYDGTIVELTRHPDTATPDRSILAMLGALAEDARNLVVVISGRERASLYEWLKDTGVDIAAEYGGFILRGGGEWEQTIVDSGEWKESVRTLFDLFALRTPGSLVEEKEFSIAWHYRSADPELAAVRSRELKDAASNLTANLDVSVTEDRKVIEVRTSHLNEGAAASLWLEGHPDFVLAIGDDWTDEDLFAAMPEGAHTIKVGLGPSRAQWSLETVEDVRALIAEMVRKGQE